jgi:FkbM family methyltransferase
MGVVKHKENVERCTPSLIFFYLRNHYNPMMLIPAFELSENWNIVPNGVLHVGAHLGEEADDYEKLGWCPVIWIEAQPKLANQLRESLDSSSHKVIEAAIWHEDNVLMNLNVATNSQSSSLLNFGTHSKHYPTVEFVNSISLETKRIDSLINPEEMPNFINIDIQGVELEALKSLGTLIEKIDYLYLEVNKRQVYENCTQVGEIDRFLSIHGFERVMTRWLLVQGWGDGLYIKKSLNKRPGFLQKLRSNRNQIIFYSQQICLQIKIAIYKVFKFRD